MPPKTRDHLKSAVQREAEAGDGTTAISWKGRTYTFVSDPSKVSGAVILAFEQERVMSALAGMLGPSQWSTVEDRPLSELAELLELMAVQLGFAGAGESSASSA